MYVYVFGQMQSEIDLKKVYKSFKSKDFVLGAVG